MATGAPLQTRQANQPIAAQEFYNSMRGIACIQNGANTPQLLMQEMPRHAGSPLPSFGQVTFQALFNRDPAPLPGQQPAASTVLQPQTSSAPAPAPQPTLQPQTSSFSSKFVNDDSNSLGLPTHYPLANCLLSTHCPLTIHSLFAHYLVTARSLSAQCWLSIGRSLLGAHYWGLTVGCSSLSMLTVGCSLLGAHQNLRSPPHSLKTC